MNKLSYICGIIFLCVTSISPNLEPSTLKIITSKYSSIEHLSYEELQAIFTLSIRYWENGTRIQLVLMKKDNESHILFVNRYLGLDIISYHRRLRNLTSSGRSGALRPIVVNTGTDMISTIEITPGSIGYYNGTIYIESNKEIKTIKIL